MLDARDPPNEHQGCSLGRSRASSDMGGVVKMAGVTEAVGMTHRTSRAARRAAKRSSQTDGCDGSGDGGDVAGDGNGDDDCANDSDTARCAY
jgi:hypothetical protein